MKKVWTATFVASAFAVGLAAQEAQEPRTPPPGGAGAGSQTQPARPTTPSASARTVTITGCVQSATASTTGAAGATTSASAEPKFVLANAKMAEGATTGAGGAVGTAGTAGRYQLEGDEKAISPHLNHQVEITGMLQSSSASATGAERSAPGSTASGPTLKVESVKMVSATCTTP